MFRLKWFRLRHNNVQGKTTTATVANRSSYTLKIKIFNRFYKATCISLHRIRTFCIWMRDFFYTGKNKNPPTSHNQRVAVKKTQQQQFKMSSVHCERQTSSRRTCLGHSVTTHIFENQTLLDTLWFSSIERPCLEGGSAVAMSSRTTQITVQWIKEWTMGFHFKILSKRGLNMCLGSCVGHMHALTCRNHDTKSINIRESSPVGKKLFQPI